MSSLPGKKEIGQDQEVTVEERTDITAEGSLFHKLVPHRRNLVTLPLQGVQVRVLRQDLQILHLQ